MAKNLAVVTIVGFLLGFAFSQTNLAEASINPKASLNRNVMQAQAVANRVFNRVSASNKQSVQACSENSECVAQVFVAAFRRYNFEAKTVFLKKKAGTAPQIQMKGAVYNGANVALNFDVHAAAIVWLLGGWRVVDPIVFQTPALESLKTWHSRITNLPEVSMSFRKI